MAKNGTLPDHFSMASFVAHDKVTFPILCKFQNFPAETSKAPHIGHCLAPWTSIFYKLLIALTNMVEVVHAF